MKRLNVLIAVSIMAVMAFAVNGFAADIESAYVDLTTQPQSNVEDLVDSGAYKDLDLTFNGRVMIMDNLGVDGSVGIPVSDIDVDNLTYRASVFARASVKELAVEPYISYADNGAQDEWGVGVRVGLINRR